jgi:hypothetical protein
MLSPAPNLDHASIANSTKRLPETRTENDEDDSPMRELKIVPERVEARTFSLISVGSGCP